MRTSAEIVTLAAAVIALLGSVLSLFISSRLAVHKERRQLLWSRELERLFELEELAGELVEEIGMYRPIPEDDSAFATKYELLGRAAGRFGRYPGVRQAIRDLYHAVGCMFAAKRDHQDERETRAELEPAYRKLLAACDAVTGRKGHRVAT